MYHGAAQWGRKREAAHFKYEGPGSWNQKMWIRILTLKVSACGALGRSPHHS